MIVGMRDVILKKMELADHYAYLRRMGIEAMEVRVQPDLTLDAFEPVQGGTLRIGTETECRNVLHASAQAGVRIGGILLITAYYTLEFDAEEEKRWIAASAELARAAGLDVLRIDIKPGKPESEGGESEDDFSPALSHGLRIT